jgi:hypothetical protein
VSKSWRKWLKDEGENFQQVFPEPDDIRVSRRERYGFSFQKFLLPGSQQFRAGAENFLMLIDLQPRASFCQAKPWEIELFLRDPGRYLGKLAQLEREKQRSLLVIKIRSFHMIDCSSRKNPADLPEILAFWRLLWNIRVT